VIDRLFDRSPDEWTRTTTSYAEMFGRDALEMGAIQRTEQTRSIDKKRIIGRMEARDNYKLRPEWAHCRSYERHLRVNRWSMR
jgi:hypothetical protein